MVGLPKPVTTGRKKRAVAWSYSKLKNWRACPRRHYHTDIAKDFTDGSDAIDFGNAVHDAIASRIAVGKPIPAHFKDEANLDMEPYAQKVLQGSASALEYEERHPGQRIVVEQQLAITADFDPCEWFDKKKTVWHRSKVDLIKFNGPVALALDWKTGKITEDSEQLLISTQCIFSHFPQVQIVRTKFIWLKEGAETALDVNRAHMPLLWAKLVPEINTYVKAVEDVNFPPRPNALCSRYCPVLSCEHNGRGG